MPNGAVCTGSSTAHPHIHHHHQHHQPDERRAATMLRPTRIATLAEHEEEQDECCSSSDMATTSAPLPGDDDDLLLCAVSRVRLVQFSKDTEEPMGITLKVRLLRDARGAVTFKIVPSLSLRARRLAKFFSARHSAFDYEPPQDDLIRCPSSGVPFRTGDILQYDLQGRPQLVAGPLCVPFTCAWRLLKMALFFCLPMYKHGFRLRSCKCGGLHFGRGICQPHRCPPCPKGKCQKGRSMPTSTSMIGNNVGAGAATSHPATPNMAGVGQVSLVPQQNACTARRPRGWSNGTSKTRVIKLHPASHLPTHIPPGKKFKLIAYGIVANLKTPRRTPRRDEIDGKHYFFVSNDALLADIQANEYLE
ncbi:hypothetical protein niasHT_036661 [Heterodera trifolii]|uniref:Guanylate kinase-like domain-containing protein n=1 Tax=Heterodera trifolii TaxID=157864 RepID=A0ABD2IBI3_9BILA